MRQRPWVWVVYIVLFGLSVPWYLPADDTPRLWLGLPYWVVLSTVAVIAIACFTAWVMQRYWTVDSDDDGDGERASR